MKKSLAGCVYIAPPERLADLKSELRHISFEQDNFWMADGPKQRAYWAQNIWQDVRRVKIASIKSAATLLKNEQRKWWHYPLECVRRTKLIQELLPKVQAKPLDFLAEPAKSPLGAFALVSEDEMIYSPRCEARVPNGEYNFLPPAYAPPSQAYLKLWEALSRVGIRPGPSDECVDLGSSPGSWTQALLALGAKVTSVDKAGLGFSDAKSYADRLTVFQGDAFKFDSSQVQNAQWIFSDIICYPDKLLELARQWKVTHPKARYVFTIKFQGQWDKKVVDDFARIANSKVVHLFNNKHELCWLSGFNFSSK